MRACPPPSSVPRWVAPRSSAYSAGTWSASCTCPSPGSATRSRRTARRGTAGVDQRRLFTTARAVPRLAVRRDRVAGPGEGHVHRRRPRPRGVRGTARRHPLWDRHPGGDMRAPSTAWLRYWLMDDGNARADSSVRTAASARTAASSPISSRTGRLARSGLNPGAPGVIGAFALRTQRPHPARDLPGEPQHQSKHQRDEQRSRKPTSTMPNETPCSDHRQRRVRETAVVAVLTARVPVCAR